MYNRKTLLLLYIVHDNDKVFVHSAMIIHIVYNEICYKIKQERKRHFKVCNKVL